MGAYHSAKKSGNFGLKSKGKVIFWKFCFESVDYLQTYSPFSFRNGKSENSLLFARISVSRPLYNGTPGQDTSKINGKRNLIWSVGKFAYHYPTHAPTGFEIIRKIFECFNKDLPNQELVPDWFSLI